MITIVSPVNNQQLTTPANLTIVATALERGGTIARVVFYNGSTVLGTVTEPGLQPASPPGSQSGSQTGSQASITLPDVGIGSYKLTVKATDGTGKTVISSAVAVSVVAGMPTTKGDGEMYYIVTDQLGTPRQVMDSKGVTVWQWDGEAFGNTPPNANPGGQGDFVFNLRFPGQYFDAETNLNQNFYRDYDPSTGRYVESDPIGLNGGITTFAYVKGNPLIYIDRFGLQQSMGFPGGSIALNEGAGYSAQQAAANNNTPSTSSPCVQKYLQDHYGKVGAWIANTGNLQQYIYSNNPQNGGSDSEAASVAAEKLGISKGPGLVGSAITRAVPGSMAVGNVVGSGLVTLSEWLSGLGELAGSVFTPFGSTAMAQARAACICDQK